MALHGGQLCNYILSKYTFFGARSLLTDTVIFLACLPWSQRFTWRPMGLRNHV